MRKIRNPSQLEWGKIYLFRPNRNNKQLATEFFFYVGSRIYWRSMLRGTRRYEFKRVDADICASIVQIDQGIGIYKIDENLEKYLLLFI